MNQLTNYLHMVTHLFVTRGFPTLLVANSNSSKSCCLSMSHSLTTPVALQNVHVPLWLWIFSCFSEFVNDQDNIFYTQTFKQMDLRVKLFTSFWLTRFFPFWKSKEKLRKYCQVVIHHLKLNVSITKLMCYPNRSTQF